ncbi:MAG: hypothetical protein JXM79_10640 [Sedimentisphaerales bacterium]|nr:hypothetical protein [Sedimentisphaerales bacterium]
MSLRNMFLVIAALWVVSAVPAGAQENLGDLVAQYGYDWMIGKWSATSDNGSQVELEYKWILDKNAMCVNVKIGDFKYHGLIMFVPSREEVIQIGADNMGATWNGTWTEDYNGAVNRNERVEPDGTTQRMDMVYIKVDNNSFKVKQYDVDSGGYRASQVRSEMTFKRQKADAAQKGAEMDGTWVGTAGGSYGEWTFTISEGNVEVKGPDGEYYSGAMTMKTGTNPKQVDFKIKKCSLAEYVGETSLGLYKLDGDKLTIAASEPGSLYRPYGLESGGDAMVFSLIRK